MCLNTKSILYFFLVLLLGTGCKKYLEVNPDTRVEPSYVDDYQAIITGSYPEASYLFTEIMSDNFRFYDYTDFNSATIVNWFKPFYLWSDNYPTNLPVGPEYAWDLFYHNIYKTNIVLQGIDNAKGDKAHASSVKGEAYLVRAYCHFILVNLFAKHYNKSTASSDLGVPYSIEAQEEGIKLYKRDDVATVYRNIESDIREGINLLDNRYIEEPQYHFSKVSAFAFFSRLYLYKEEWDKCIAYSDSALMLNNTIRDLPKDYEAFFETGDFKGFAEDYCTSGKENILLFNKTLEWNSFYATGFYANEFLNYFEDDDLRGKLFVFNSNTSVNYNMQKFFGQYKDGQQYSNVTLFNVEELYLNRAEAFVRKSSPDLNNAIDDLNMIRKQRFLNYIPLTIKSVSTNTDYTEVENVLLAVLRERRLELCYEGFRWFDLKRFKIQITHSSESGDKVLKSNDLRYVLQIPEKELSANKLMEPNPR
jgi:starch-binding outer membrane protein, SusD/RagB family